MVKCLIWRINGQNVVPHVRTGVNLKAKWGGKQWLGGGEPGLYGQQQSRCVKGKPNRPSSLVFNNPLTTIAMRLSGGCWGPSLSHLMEDLLGLKLLPGAQHP